MYKLYTQWLDRALVPGCCVICTRDTQSTLDTLGTLDNQCSQHCATEWQLLSGISLGVKRLLEADNLDDLTDELLEALLSVTYPQRERDAQQFRNLVAWRVVSQRHDTIVKRLLARMRKLPRPFREVANDAVLQLMPGIVSLKPRLKEWRKTDVRCSYTSQGLSSLIALEKLRVPSPLDDAAALRLASLATSAPVTLTALDLTWGDKQRAYVRQRTSRRSLRSGDRDFVVEEGDPLPLPSLLYLSQLQSLTLRELSQSQSLSELVPPSVTQLTLDNEEIVTGRPMPPLGALGAGLTALRLHAVRLRDPDLLGNLRVIRELRLERVRGISLAPLATLTTLERLELGTLYDVDYALIRVDNDTLMPLTRLVELNVTSTGDCGDETLRALPLLETLNPTHRMTVEAIARLAHLQKLDLRSGMRRWPLGMLASQLKSLHIASEYLWDTVDYDQLGQLTQLTELRIINQTARYDALTVESLLSLTALKRLYLRNTAGFHPLHIRSLTRLETLGLDGKYPYGSVVMLTQLTELDLRGCRTDDYTSDGIVWSAGNMTRLRRVWYDAPHPYRPALRLGNVPNTCFVDEDAPTRPW